MPILEGCYTQGKTIDTAIKNIREVIEMILEEKEAQEIFEILSSFGNGTSHNYSLSL